MAKPAPTKRSFRVDPHIIMTLIKAQAGSLQKAMMEAISNSMDAAASEIRLSVKADQVIIEDNGKGLTQRAEIEAFFEVFGFDHTNLGREHGRFGVGRGQMFCYGKNTWHTHRFQMGVDIKAHGLDYDLIETAKPHQGMRITIDLYEKLSMGELYRLEEDFRRLVKYAAIPVYYNGTRISDDPTTKKWTHETDEAWFQIKANGSLDIYSQGLFVQSVGSHHHGVGGVLVSKPGKAFALNMARNDILASECAVWKTVKKDLAQLAKPFRDKAEAEHTLTNGQRKRMALDALTAQSTELLDKDLFTLTNGKHVALATLLDRQVWAVGPARDRVGDRVMQSEVGYVLHETTLDRFGVETLAELHKRLAKALATIQVPPAQLAQFQALTLHETTAPLQSLVTVDFKDIPVRQLSEDEKAMLTAARHASAYVVHAINRGLGLSYTSADAHKRRKERTLKVMESDTIEGCTDGSQTIWINRSFLAHPGQGLKSFAKLAYLLTHEYVHANNSQTSHEHGVEFYETFHEAVFTGEVAKASILMMGKYAKVTKRKPTATLLNQIDQVFDPTGSDVVLFQGQRTALAEEQEAGAAVDAPPKKRRSARP